MSPLVRTERDKIHKRFKRRKCWLCMIAQKENHTLKAWSRATK